MNATAAPLPLGYASPIDRTTHRRRRDRLLATLCLLAAVTPFFDFTYDTSPLDAAMTDPREILSGGAMLYLLGTSFFIALPLLAWRLRLAAVMAAPGRRERRVAAAVAVACALPVAGLLAGLSREAPGYATDGWSWSNAFEVLGMLVFPTCVFATGAVLALARWRRDLVAAVTLLLATAYVTNAAVALAAFYTDPEAGYFLTAGGVIALIVLVVIVVRDSRA